MSLQTSQHSPGLASYGKCRMVQTDDLEFRIPLSPPSQCWDFKVELRCCATHTLIKWEIKYILSTCLPRRKHALTVGFVALSTATKDMESCFPSCAHPEGEIVVVSRISKCSVKYTLVRQLMFLCIKWPLHPFCGFPVWSRLFLGST